MTPKARGRIPRWCSAGCRQRAWEQSRAAASGLAAVRIVERRIEVPADTHPRPSPVPIGWPARLADLATALDRGRIYDRHLPELARALQQVLDAYERRTGRSR